LLDVKGHNLYEDSQPDPPLEQESLALGSQEPHSPLAGEDNGILKLKRDYSMPSQSKNKS
jgi:hypothetical protein